jgi:hypothetical protein
MNKLVIFLFFAMIAGLSCKKDEKTTVVPPKTYPNLVSNPGFETIDQQPSSAGWTGTGSSQIDTAGILPQVAQLVRDAPEDGGVWCLQVVSGWLPAVGYAVTGITGEQGTNIYRLSFRMKVIQETGGFLLEQWRNGSLITKKENYATVSTWKLYTMTDTLEVLPADTLRIRFSAGSAESYGSIVRFDLVMLENIGTPNKMK